MEYSGKQIRIEFKNGDEAIFRGSSYTLRIYENTTTDDPDFNSVQVFFNGNDFDWWYFNEVESVVEDQFSNEIIS